MQPEGPSFQVTGHNVVWQQWHLHVGFNFREGLVLSHIGYGLQWCCAIARNASLWHIWLPREGSCLPVRTYCLLAVKEAPGEDYHKHRACSTQQQQGLAETTSLPLQV